MQTQKELKYRIDGEPCDFRGMTIIFPWSSGHSYFAIERDHMIILMVIAVIFVISVMTFIFWKS